MGSDFDVIVVGAGPAGASAALTAASAGAKVALVERGPFAGSKNVFGGVLYLSVLDEIVPDWRRRAPIQRWVTQRRTMLLGSAESLTVSYTNEAWSVPPYNGATALRSQFDRWLSEEAHSAGADLITSTTVVGLLWADEQRRQIRGVRTDQIHGEITAPIVILCDGVNSRLAREAGLYPHFGPQRMTLGVKEVLALPASTIEERFGLDPGCGLDIEILGATGAIAGGGFLYTNLDSISIGVILSLPSLRDGRRRPEEILGALKEHPQILPMIRGTSSLEYSAHMIPEGGFTDRPRLAERGVMVAGDAASMTLASGLWLEGVNYALASGAVAGRCAATWIGSGSEGPMDPSLYVHGFDGSPNGRNLRRLRHSSSFIMSHEVQHDLPVLALSAARRLFNVDDNAPKPRLRTILTSASKEANLGKLRLLRTMFRGWRAFR